ncbi:ABC transporter substrate-binding protein [Fodinisporobacter ferrooxydans]|uniref:ABC transporter substrate-binding protein n=1 Tax=Fodinisporobacter ferrooxydans TaxID=2901836 RepID=A0ABY4CIN3_9BACL|nr:ABC transporter substrate-binding protein [Alicyclobacillaceae bacterium MYW30-H2]
MLAWKPSKKVGVGLFTTGMAVSLILAGCGTSTAGGSKSASASADNGSGNGNGKLTVVKVAMDNAPAEAGLILGMKLGYFQKQGIKVDYEKFASGADMLTSLASGQIDVARTVISAGLFNAAARGVPIRLAADGGQNLPDKPYFALVVSKKLANKVKDYKDLKGLKVGIASKGSINEMFLSKALEKGGLTTKDVKEVIVDSFPDLLTGVKTGAMDAAVQIEPLITSGVDQGVYSWWKNPKDYAPDEEISTIAYGKKLVDNKDLGNRFMVAYLQGVRAYDDAIIYGNKDRDKIIKILTKETFVNDPKTYQKMNPPFLDPNGQIPKDGVVNDQNWYAAQGMVKKKTNVDNLVDPSYADYALKKLGKYQKPQK